MEHIDIIKEISKNLQRGMGIEEIKQTLLNKSVSDYEINSAIEELNLEKGRLTYYEGERHDEIVEELFVNELKKKTIEIYNDEKWPTVAFENVRILVDEDSITINSKVKLDLEKFDAEKIQK